MNIETVANWCSALFALVAEVLWYLSARVKMPRTFPARAMQPDEHVENPVDGPNDQHAAGTVRSDALVQLGESLREQSILSARAAACASIPAIAQAVALVFKA